LSIKRLEGFHIRAAWRMLGKRPVRKEDRSWTYPCSEDVLQAVGLKLIAHYMGVWGQTIANFIVNRPIYELCAGAVRKRGLRVPPFWWNQPMDLDLAWERRTSAKVIIAQGCARGGGRGNVNMRLLYVPNAPLNTLLVQTGKSWRG
jgi:hypothetical protein